MSSISSISLEMLLTEIPVRAPTAKCMRMRKSFTTCATIDDFERTWSSHQLSWEANKPDSFRDPEGIRWEDGGSGARGREIEEAVRVSAVAQKWERAQHHYCGSGLKNGGEARRIGGSGDTGLGKGRSKKFGSWRPWSTGAAGSATEWQRLTVILTASALAGR